MLPLAGLTITAALLAWTVGCAAGGSVGGLPDTQIRGKPDAALTSLARRVMYAYRGARFVSIDGEVTAPPQRIRYHTEMAPRKLRTELYIRDKLVSVISVADGRVQETRPQWRRAPDGKVLENLTLSYDSPTPNGTGDLVLRQGIDDYLCLVGSTFQTWIGPASKKVEFLQNRIENGVLLPPETVNGRHCLVVMWELKEPDYVRRDVFFFDSQTYFLVKWDTLVSDGQAEPTLQRSRVMQVHILPEPPPGKWWLYDTERTRDRPGNVGDVTK